MCYAQGHTINIMLLLLLHVGSVYAFVHTTTVQTLYTNMQICSMCVLQMGSMHCQQLVCSPYHVAVLWYAACGTP